MEHGTRKLKQIRVYMDGLNTKGEKPIVLSAWSDGRTWNGWATPYFEKNEADWLVAAFNRKPGGMGAWYDREKDSYVFSDVDLDPPEEEFGGIQVGGRKLYPIGVAMWCWSTADDLQE